MAKFEHKNEMSLLQFVNTLSSDLSITMRDYNDETGNHHHYWVGNNGMYFTVSSEAEPLLQSGDISKLKYLECKRADLPDKPKNWFRCILKADITITIRRTAQ